MRRFQWMMASALIAAGVSLAQTSGTVWQNIPDPGNAADPANRSAALANAQFNSTGVNYCAGGFTCPATPYDVADFLNHPTFNNLHNGFNSAISLDNTEVELTGTVLLAAGANPFNITHDDGLTLTLSGGPGTLSCTLCVNQPLPTAPAITPFSVTASLAGTYNFVLDYAECCGPPAVLQWTFTNGTPVGTPEPGSIALLGTALCGAVLLLKRRRKT